MIHGMGMGAWYWENFKRFFEERGYQCHTPTLRHHEAGPQDPPPPNLATTSLLDYAQDLEQYIRSLDEKPLLMGHSMGGLLSQMIAARGAASGAVLLTPATPSGINNMTFTTLKTFWSIYSKWRYWRNPVRLSFKAALYGGLHLLPEADQKSVYKRFVYDSGRAYFEIANWFLDTRGASKVDATRVTCPVLVVAATLDNITPASLVRKIADKYRSVATYKEFENHAHWLLIEPGWENIAEFISGWLNRTYETRH